MLGTKKTGKDQNSGFYVVFLFLAFFAPFELMLSVFARNIIYPFGDQSFLYSDLLHQYMPFFQEFVRKLKAGESLAYSWNVGVGSNFLELYGYYLASPFYWLAKIFPESLAVEFLSYLVVVKVGLAGHSAFLFLDRRSLDQGAEKASFFALVFSCFYAMSGYVAAYNYNVMWLDGIILAPLILLGLERLVKDGRMALYVLSLALCIFTNFYLSIMICIFLVIYFLFLFFTEKGRIRAMGRFVFGSLLAGGMAGVILIPEVCALMGSEFGSSTFPEKWEKYFNVLQVLARHCMGITTETEMDHWPNIYCGVAVFFLLPLYFVNRGIPRRRRIGFLLMAVFFLLSFEFNVLEFCWHGMNFPDCLPARQSFLYILLVLIMCHDCLSHGQELSPKWVTSAYAAAMLMIFAVDRFLKSDDFHHRDCYVTMLFVTLYAICLFLYRTKAGTRMTDWLAVISYVLVLAECTLNMSWTSVVTTDRVLYDDHVKEYQALYERNGAVSGELHRAEMFSNFTRNDGAIAGFPTASMFASTLNSHVKDFYVTMGMRYGKVFYSYEGATAFTGALLNVDYLFSDRKGLEGEIYQRLDEENEIYLYGSKYALPFGYVAPLGFELEDGQTDNGIALQCHLAKRLGIEGELFTRVGQSDEEGCYVCDHDGFYYGLLKETDVYRITVKGAEDWSRAWRFLKRNSILQLGELKEGQRIHLINTDTGEALNGNAVEIYRMDAGVLEQAVRRLGETHLTEVKVDAAKLSGHLELKEAGRLIMTVPYEKGWRVYVNGIKTEPVIFGDAWTALDLGAGEYEIEMEYVPEGSFAGSMVSLLSFLCLFGLYGFLWLRRRKDPRNKKEEK